MTSNPPLPEWPADTGVLLIAIHRSHYGELAYNMALSLHLGTPSRVPITLIADEPALSSLSEKQCEVFERIIDPDPTLYVEPDGSKNPFRLKTWLDHLTPYRQTLYLDVDGLFFTRYRDLRELFEHLSETSFHIQEEFRYDRSWVERPSQYFWGALDEIWSGYKLPDNAWYVDYNSSFFWFRATEANRRFFEHARQLYDAPRAKLKKVGAFACDEAPFSIASAQLGHYSPTPTFRPLYIQNFSEERPWSREANPFQEFATQDDFRKVIARHYFVSLPAIPPTRSVVKLYHHFARSNAKAWGDGDFFAFRVEKKLLKEWLAENPLCAENATGRAVGPDGQ